MKVPNHPFDPSLQPVFAGLVSAALNKLPDSRDLFFALVHSSEHAGMLPYAYCFLKQHLQAAQHSYDKQFSKPYHPESIGKLPVKALTATIEGYGGLGHYTPVILTELYWLQAVSQAATSQSPIAVDLMAVYLNLTGHGSYLPLFEGMLQLSGLKLPALHSRAFVKQTEIADSLFDFAALQLAFSTHCRAFFPEMLGFTLACCKSSLFSYFGANENIAQLLSHRQRLLYAQIPAVTRVIQQYAALFPDQADAIWERVQTGFYLYQQHLQYCQQLEQQQVAFTPQQEVVALLQVIAPKAVGHHGAIKLAGKGLDGWFAQSPFDGDAFLAALRQSPYVNRTVPECSVLLRLFEFGGPMFGVLNQAERDVLKAWLLSDADIPPVVKAKPLPLALPDDGCALTADLTDYNQLSTRQLYYYLLNADIFPGVLAKARQHVHSVLWRAQYLNLLPFKHYSHEAFADHMQGIYQAEVDNYEPLAQKPKLSRQAYLWGIEQFAPSILTDGCWLQHIRQLTLCANGAIGDILFKIYDDETGHGILAQNHPFIYQQLLDSVAIQVPPINSRAFIGHPGFIDSAFDIPVYLMAISKFPSAFLPELLGLNMAIEISGLGKVYLRLAEELRYYGIDPAIVNVHISIDNVATGHTALAVKAIQRYMDDVLASYGKRAMHNHWRRIYTGYCSLQTASTMFKYALAIQYWLKRKDRIMHGLV